MNGMISNAHIKKYAPIAFSTVAFVFFTHNYFKLSQWGTDWMTQLLDYNLLKDHLFESILYDFYQPPLVNLPIGLLIKLAPTKYTYLVAGIHYLLILATVYIIYQLLIKLQISRNVSLILSVFFLLNPSLWYTARISYYQMPVIFLITALLLSIIIYLKDRKTLSLIFIYAILAILINIRTAITPALFFIILVAFLFVDRQNIKRHLLIAAIVFPLIGISYIKNYLIYGKFQRTLISGVNFRATGDFTSSSIRNKLFEEGKITEVFRLGPWQYPLTRYKPYLNDTIIPNKFKNIAMLNQIESNQFNNYRHYYMLEIVDRLQSETMEVVKAEPNAIYKMALFGNYIFFQPPGDYGMNEGNIKKSAFWYKFFNVFLQGQLALADPQHIPIPNINSPSGENTLKEIWNSITIERMCLWVILLYLLSFLFLSCNAIDFIKSRSNVNTFFIFFAIIFFYTYILYSSYGLYEGNRLRAEMLSLEIVMLGVVGREIKHSLKW